MVGTWFEYWELGLVDRSSGKEVLEIDRLVVERSGSRMFVCVVFNMFKKQERVIAVIKTWNLDLWWCWTPNRDITTRLWQNTAAIDIDALNTSV
jgi:hypothetical protein